MRVRLKLRVRAGGSLGGSVAARLGVGGATAEEVTQDSLLKKAPLVVAEDGASASAAAAAAGGAAAAAGGGAGGGAGGDAGEIVIEIEALELHDKQRLPCRTVELVTHTLPSYHPYHAEAALPHRGGGTLPSYHP